jgi:hypothetical protein
MVGLLEADRRLLDGVNQRQHAGRLGGVKDFDPVVGLDADAIVERRTQQRDRCRYPEWHRPNCRCRATN